MTTSMREVLEPFLTFAETFVEKAEAGWQWKNGSGSDRVCDWFGPSDFGLLQHFAALASHVEQEPVAALSSAPDRLSEEEPVAWIEFADNGNIRFWTSDPARAWTEGDNGRPLRKFTLAELVALAASSRLDRERLARALCKSGKFDTGQGTCALVCMDQLGDPRKSGCHHCTTVHGALADAIMRETR